MQHQLHRWHRRVGVPGALVAIYLAITGLLLNHTHDLGLDRTHVRLGILLALYDITPQVGVTADTGRLQASRLGQTLFLADRIIGEDESRLSGAVFHQDMDMYVIATRRRLHLLTPDGLLIETLDHNAGLPPMIHRIGLDDSGRVVIDDGTGLFIADADLVNWSPQRPHAGIRFSRVRVMDPSRRMQLAQSAPGPGPSWERVLQDLHSGRLFGRLGSLVIDRFPAMCWLRSFKPMLTRPHPAPIIPAP